MQVWDIFFQNAVGQRSCNQLGQAIARWKAKTKYLMLKKNLTIFFYFFVEKFYFENFDLVKIDRFWRGFGSATAVQKMKFEAKTRSKSSLYLSVGAQTL